MATPYIVMKEPTTGFVVIEATSSDAALRQAVKDGYITVTGSYVATPERSFKAVPLTLEQTTSVKFG